MPLLSIDIEAKFAQVLDSLATIEKRAQGTASSLKSALAGIGVGLSIGGFTAIIKSSIDAQDHLNDLNKTTGIAIEQLAGLGVAAKQSGSDLDSIAQSMNKLSVNVGKDGKGIFKDLGVSAKDPLEALGQLADIFVKIQDPQLKAAVGAAGLGKSWAGTAPLLAEGSERIKEMVERGSRLSKITAESAKAADEFNDKLVLLTGTHGLLNSAVVAILPLLNKLADDMLAAKEGTDKFGNSSNLLLESLKPLLVLGSEIAFTFETIGAQATILNEQIKLLYSGEVQQAANLGKVFSEDRERRKKELEDWQQSILDIGSAKQKAAAAAASASKEGPKPTSKETADAEAKARAFLARQNDKNDKNARALAEATAAQADAVAKIEIDQTKFAAETQLEILDRLHSASLVSEEKYWDERFRIQKGAYEIELAAAIKNVAERQRLVDNPPKVATPADRKKNETALLEAKAREAAIRAAQGRTQILNSADQEEAVTRVRLEDGQKLIKMYEDQVAVTERAKDVVQDFTDARRLDTQEQEFALSLVGQSVAAQENLIGLRRIELDFRRAAAALPNGGDGQAEALEQLRLKAEAAKISFIALYDAIREKSRSAFTGAVDALTEYIDHATNAAEQTRNALTNAFKSAEDALVEFAKTGKLNFKALADSIITDLIRIQARQAIAGLGQAALPFFNPGRVGGSGIEAHGDAFSRGNIIPFASGGIVNSPTLFRMANGAGLMGEAGPEAIMPLRRGSDGKLGVVAQRVNAAAPVVNVNTTFTQATNPAEMAALMGPLVTRAVQAGILRQQQPGGSLAR